MLWASVLTVNSHLKQPSATELSARDVAEPHRPFKILPWLKGHQSARRAPYLWVTSPRDIHSVTSPPTPCYYAEKTGSKENQVTVCKGKDEYWLCSWRKGLHWAYLLHSKASDGLQACWWCLQQLWPLQGSYFTEWGHFQPFNAGHLCSQPSAFTHIVQKQETHKRDLFWESSSETE